ncbi:MAG TPA: hypothetical protein VGN61_09055 [Verrucomicrobiae bacterium]
MKKILLVVWTLIVSCAVSFSQTNKPPSTAPSVLIVAPKAAATNLQNTSPPLAHFEDVNAYSLSQTSQGAHPNEDGIITRVGHEGLLSPQPAVPPALKPKIYHIGHVKIYSSALTAAARKNPFAILDATFLNISF